MVSDEFGRYASDNFGHIAGFLRSVMKEIGDAVLSETSALYRRATKCRVDDARLPWVSAYGEWSSGRNFALILPRNARLERMISLLLSYRFSTGERNPCSGARSS